MAHEDLIYPFLNIRNYPLIISQIMLGSLTFLRYSLEALLKKIVGLRTLIIFKLKKRSAAMTRFNICLLSFGSPPVFGNYEFDYVREETDHNNVAGLRTK